MTNEKEQQLELLNRLFDAARGNIDEEWTDDCYTLANLIVKVTEPPELVARNYATGEVIDTLVNTYKIPKNVATNYVLKSSEFMDNVMDAIEDAMVQELEEFVASTDILSHQGAGDELVINGTKLGRTSKRDA